MTSDIYTIKQIDLVSAYSMLKRWNVDASWLAETIHVGVVERDILTAPIPYLIVGCGFDETQEPVVRIRPLFISPMCFDPEPGDSYVESVDGTKYCFDNYCFKLKHVEAYEKTNPGVLIHSNSQPTQVNDLSILQATQVDKLSIVQEEYSTLKIRRTRCDVTQEEAARRCKVSLKTISRWDHGLFSPENYPGRRDKVAFLQWSAGYVFNRNLLKDARAKNRATPVDPRDLDEMDNESAFDP